MLCKSLLGLGYTSQFTFFWVSRFLVARQGPVRVKNYLKARQMPGERDHGMLVAKGPVKNRWHFNLSTGRAIFTYHRYGETYMVHIHRLHTPSAS